MSLEKRRISDPRSSQMSAGPKFSKRTSAPMAVLRKLASREAVMQPKMARRSRSSPDELRYDLEMADRSALRKNGANRPSNEWPKHWDELTSSLDSSVASVVM